MRTWRSRGAWICLLSASLAWPGRGEAEEDAKKVCAAAFANGQRLMRSGSLIEARKQLVLCGGSQCPAVMQAECQQWLSSVEASTPTVVFQVPSTSGGRPADVRLSVDGGDFVSLDGRAVSMDPGSHDVTIVASGFATVRTRVVVSEGEKLHHESVTLAPASPPPDVSLAASTAPVHHESGRRPSRLVVPIAVASSVAALAGITAVYFGVKARSDDRNLDRCTPNCSRTAVDDVKGEYLWTNVSIGLAAAGVVTAVVLFLVGRTPTPDSTRASIGVGVVPYGFAATLTTPL